MQKNVLSIRGEDRRYWKYPIVWILVIWKLSQNRASLPESDYVCNPWWTKFFFQNFHGLSSQWLCLGAPLPRGRRSTSAKNLFQGPEKFDLTSLPQIRGAMDSIQHELVGEAGQEVQIGSWLLCRGVQQQGPGGQVGLGHSLLVDQLRHSSTFNVISSAWTKTLQSSPPSPPSTTPTPPPRSCGSLTARSATNPLR